ncbi:hypothetical protein MK139_00230 [bacterium]|nr:hypothetical protein [bacterium]
MYLQQPHTFKNGEPADCASAGSPWYHLGGGEAGGIAISPQRIAAVLSHTQWLIDRGNLAAAEDFDLIAGGTLLHWDGSR